MVLGNTLGSALDARRSHQSILKEINPEYPFEGVMLKLKLQYSGHLMHRADSLEKTLMPGGQRSLPSYSPWGHNESDMTEPLKNNNKEIDKPLKILIM